MRFCRLFSIAAIALSAGAAAAAEDWVFTGGPVAATIAALDADSTTALATDGTAGRMWRYQPGSGEWVSSPSPSSAGDFREISAMGAGQWLVGGEAGGLHLSEDGGHTWRPANTGVPSYLSLEGAKLREFDAFARRGSTWLAGGGPGAEWPPSGSKGASAQETGGAGALRSTDSAQTWQRSVSGLPVIGIGRDGSPHYPAILSLAVTSDGFIAGTKAHGVYRSTDDGRSWTQISAGLPTSSWSRGLAPMVAVAEFEGELFAGTDAFDTAATLFRSPDGGANWSDVAELPHAASLALEVHDGRLFVAMGRILTGPGAGDGGGVWATSDGASWTPAGESLARHQVTALAVQEESLLAGTAAGQVWRLDSVCAADLDGDGQLTFFDFLAFQNLFAAGDPRADFDGDGALTFFDFLAFQNEFAAGCA